MCIPFFMCTYSQTEDDKDEDSDEACRAMMGCTLTSRWLKFGLGAPLRK